jgi:drug/metabolite transporter (DMT)-like permease
MPPHTKSPASTLLVVIAFATVYIVWGSTYFFIRMAEQRGGLPPFLLGAIRFFTAGILLMGWCVIKGEKIFVWKNMMNAAVVGILLLFVANGIVIWSEQTLPSAMVAIMVSSAPIWFVLIDKPNWGINFKSKATIVGLIIGFAGVVLLFSEQIEGIFKVGTGHSKLPWMLLLMFGSIAWASGSLYAKYKLTTGSASVNTAWQMIVAGVVFIPGSLLRHEADGLHWQNIPASSRYALIYLILFGSIAAYSAYVWLLQVRPVTQVSTYAYVNPVIAVILGVFFADENISLIQIAGLIVILGSVLLINLSKYRKKHPFKQTAQADNPELSSISN